jgi:hypothetical protein
MNNNELVPNVPNMDNFCCWLQYLAIYSFKSAWQITLRDNIMCVCVCVCVCVSICLCIFVCVY